MPTTPMQGQANEPGVFRTDLPLTHEAMYQVFDLTGAKVATMTVPLSLANATTEDAIYRWLDGVHRERFRCEWRPQLVTEEAR